MRIVVVNQYVVPPEAGGGTRHLDLASRWAAAGHHVVVLSGSFNHFAGGPGSERITERRIAGVWLRPLWTPGYSGNGVARAVDMAAFAAQVWRERRLIAASDVVLASTPHPGGVLAALWATRRSPAKVAVEIRDLWPQTLVDLGGIDGEGVAARLLYRLERHVVSTAELTVGVPPRTHDYFAERGLAPRRYLHIPNGIGVGKVTGRATSHEVIDRIDAMVATGTDVFLYAGSLGSANALDAVVEAAARRRAAGSHLMVLGDGPQRAALVALAGRVGADNVTFTGQLPKDVARTAMSRATANVFHLLDAPVFRYGLSPNKLVEYLAAGVPLIYAGPAVENPATSSGAVVEARPGDASSIASAMQRVSAMSRKHRAETAARTQTYATNHHDLDRLAHQLLQALESL
ncbi:glycosyltransferase family 4 protein [Pseudactinotalea suaedae]|uniref:glycosyltransferase family 4 protein n=1 Tax=Pseudactinotalea suaedae TaxID=1524924 RepID=UPI0012E2B4BC|nr:glycosyltransferase family 4 protein [Pseudactinotalea suaedae]